MVSTEQSSQRHWSYPTYFEIPALPGAGRLSMWAIVGGLLAGASLVCFLRWHVPALLGTFMPLGLCVAIVPAVMKGIYAILFFWVQDVPSFLENGESSRQGFEQWVEGEFNRFGLSRVPSYAGVGSIPLTTAAFWLGGAFVGLPLLGVVVCLISVALASFVAAAGLVGVSYLASSIWRLGRCFSVRLSGHVYGVLSTGRMLVKCYALVAIAWCFYTSSATWGLANKWIPLLVLAVPSLAFFIGSFVICQIPLHRRMVECKRAKLAELADLIERLTPKDSGGVSGDLMRQLDFNIAKFDRVRKWPEWPFGIRNLSAVVGTSVVAVTPQLIHIMIPLLGMKTP